MYIVSFRVSWKKAQFKHDNCVYGFGNSCQTFLKEGKYGRECPPFTPKNVLVISAQQPAYLKSGQTSFPEGNYRRLGNVILGAGTSKHGFSRIGA